MFFAFAVAGWGDEQVALAVGLALVASCTIATLVAMALPAAFHRFGRDPAFGSGPLATVLQDLLSIAFYLAAVVVLVDQHRRPFERRVDLAASLRWKERLPWSTN